MIIFFYDLIMLTKIISKTALFAIETPYILNMYSLYLLHKDYLYPVIKFHGFCSRNTFQGIFECYLDPIYAIQSVCFYPVIGILAIL